VGSPNLSLTFADDDPSRPEWWPPSCTNSDGRVVPYIYRPTAYIAGMVADLPSDEAAALMLEAARQYVTEGDRVPVHAGEPVVVIPAGVPGPDGIIRPYPIYSDAFDLIFDPPDPDTGGRRG
jgi:hypothetical protein